MTPCSQQCLSPHTLLQHSRAGSSCTLLRKQCHFCTWLRFPAKLDCWRNHRHWNHISAAVPGAKPSNTLGTPERPALCWESHGSRAQWHTGNTELYTSSFFPQTCPGFAQGKEVSGTCWGRARLVPVQGHFTGAAHPREILVLQQPLGLVALTCSPGGWDCRKCTLKNPRGQACSFVSSSTRSGLFKCDSRHWNSKHCAVKQITPSCSILASNISSWQNCF